MTPHFCWGNTFLGVAAGEFNITGYENTLLGEGAGYYNTTGGGNTFVVSYAGSRNWINASSRDYKENIEALTTEEASDLILRTKPGADNEKSS